MFYFTCDRSLFGEAPRRKEDTEKHKRNTQKERAKVT